MALRDCEADTPGVAEDGNPAGQSMFARARALCVNLLLMAKAVPHAPRAEANLATAGDRHQPGSLAQTASDATQHAAQHLNAKRAREASEVSSPALLGSDASSSATASADLMTW